MRLFLMIAWLWLALTLAACQEQNVTQPEQPQQETPAAIETATPAPPAGQVPAAEGEAQTKGNSPENEVFEVTREDAMRLLDGRFLLTIFMNETDDIPVPLAEQWSLRKVESEDGTQRIFTFESGSWEMKLREPGTDAPGVLYYAQVSEAGGAPYMATIHQDGTVAPAQ